MMRVPQNLASRPPVRAKRLGREPIHALEGLGDRTSSLSHSAHRRDLFFSHEGQFFQARANGTKRFWHGIRDLLDKEYPGSFMVAEWSYPADAVGEGGFHAAFYHWFPGNNDLLQKESWRILNGYSEGHSFLDKEDKGSITGFLASHLDQYRRTVGKGYIHLPLGNHDLSRLNIKRSANDLEIIYAFSLTMPGVPFMFYGNEIGTRQLYGLPYVEGAYKPRAGGRTLMQWTSGKDRGSSEADPERLYLPVDEAPDAPIRSRIRDSC